MARLLVQEALACHARHCGSSGSDYTKIERSHSSLKLELGTSCGGDLSDTLPHAVAIARSAFQKAALQLPDNVALPNVARGPLSGLSLLYGLNASMASHYDSPTQVGQREEWLAMITLGNTALFRCNDEVIQLHSGDVVVMDSMAILHGVECIIANQDTSMSLSLGLPAVEVRLGILLWQGRQQASTCRLGQLEVVEGIATLFDEAEDLDGN